MIALPRWVGSALIWALAFYTDVFAVVSILKSRQAALDVVALVLFIACATTIGLVRTDGRVARAVQIAAVPLTAVIPLLVTHGLDPARDSYSAGAWHVTAVACISVLLMVRGRRALSTVTIGALVVQTVLWAGFPGLVTFGVAAVCLLVGISIVTSWAVARTEREMHRFLAVEREAVEWRAAQDAFDLERRARLVKTNEVAEAMLRRIVDAGGRLDEADRAECRVLEQTIRDEIRGRRLLNDAVRAQVIAHRRRGAIVQVNDDGGVDDVDAAAMEPLLDRVAEALSGLTSDRIIIRTAPRDSEKALSVVAMSIDPVAAALGVDDGDDQVDLWLELERPARV